MRLKKRKPGEAMQRICYDVSCMSSCFLKFTFYSYRPLYDVPIMTKSENGLGSYRSLVVHK